MESAVVVIAVWPSHFIVTAGRLVEVSGVEITGKPPFEIPTPIDTLIVIPVKHLHDHPLTPTVLRGRLMLIF